VVKIEQTLSRKDRQKRASLDPASRRNRDGSGCLSVPPSPRTTGAIFLINLGGEFVKTAPNRAGRNFAALHAFVFVGGKQRSS
jgi:hypothetical protein